MKQKLLELINVKSIVTIMMTFVFCVMSVSGRLEQDRFITIFTVVISFYFGTQAAKKREGDNDGGTGH